MNPSYISQNKVPKLGIPSLLTSIYMLHKWYIQCPMSLPHLDFTMLLDLSAYCPTVNAPHLYPSSATISKCYVLIPSPPHHLRDAVPTEITVILAQICSYLLHLVSLTWFGFPSQPLDPDSKICPTMLSKWSAASSHFIVAVCQYSLPACSLIDIGHTEN